MEPRRTAAAIPRIDVSADATVAMGNYIVVAVVHVRRRIKQAKDAIPKVVVRPDRGASVVAIEVRSDTVTHLAPAVPAPVAPVGSVERGHIEPVVAVVNRVFDLRHHQVGRIIPRCVVPARG